MKNHLYLSLCIILICISSGAKSCEWPDGFETGVKHFTTNCAVDKTKPIFTRDGAIVCPTTESFMLAENSMDIGWHYAPTFGVAAPADAVPGMKTPVEFYGCQLLHDGIPLTLIENGAFLRTDRGYVSLMQIRNK